MLVLVVLFSVSAIAQAQCRIGFHGANVSGDDLEQPGIGFGAQVVLPMTDMLGWEISATRFEDKAEDLKINITHVAATLQLSTLVIDQRLRLYGGLGLSFNYFDAEVSIPGYTVEIESMIGFHAAAGAGVYLTKDIELFAEYRSVWADTEATVRNRYDCQVVKSPFDFDIIRVGMNFNF